ncbi:sugar transferase [Terrabacter sp. Root85]|uniref:sugar transferase n=1 Tax=Terrabacter sp. Root85 TaxID=1736603 RepID=UPI0009E82129|nr:sugar transferase [Terrabacter sp. Root85]
MSKRLFDVVLAGLGLAIISPICVLLSLAISLDSIGPVVYRQVRIGRYGVPFTMFKFRSMSESVGGSGITVGSDARITRVGAVIRKTKLDELPQLINVLRGDMSLVGPRPELPQYVAHWPTKSRSLILSVRPGITDPAAIRFRHEASLLGGKPDPEDYYIREIMPAKVEEYVAYARNRSMWRDLSVLARTVGALFKRDQISAGRESS